jgi:dUTP pyrophosphatase
MNLTMETLKFLKLSRSAVLPTRGSAQAAGLDLYAAENVQIDSGQRAAVKTGLAVAVPESFYGRVAPRSGLALRAGIDVLAGVVDSDYRGELICILINLGEDSFSIKAGDRIAQLIIQHVITPDPEWADLLETTARHDRGFGSTGG